MYLTLILIGIFILFVIVTDLGPQHSEKKFWVVLMRIRAISDLVCAAAFVCLLILAGMITLVAGIRNWMNGGGTSFLVSGGVVVIILCICYFCIRNLRASAKRGEACECCGDCRKCKIQCRTNEKYYGLKHDTNENTNGNTQMRNILDI